jgi:hypothetical protein
MKVLTVIGAILLIAILFLWVGMVPAMATPNNSDAAGNSLSRAFASIYAIVIWILLAVLLILAGVNGEMPAWCAALAVILVPASGVAAVVAGDLLAELKTLGIGAKWLIAIPAVAPPLLVFFALWAYYPAFRSAVPSSIAGGVVWGVVLILSILPWHMVTVKNQARQERSAAEAKRAADVKARFERLTPESPLWEWVPFLDDYRVRDQAFQHVRSSPTRQADAEIMLERGDFPLLQLRLFELEPTPQFCDKLYAFVSKREEALRLAVPKSKDYSSIASDVQGATTAILWLQSNHRDCKELAGRYFDTVSAYRGEPGWDATQLRLIRDGKD